MMEGVAEEQLFVGSPHSLWDYILFPAVKKFRRKHPEIGLRLITGHSDEITEKLLGGLADAGIRYVPPYQPGLEVIPLRRIPLSDGSRGFSPGKGSAYPRSSSGAPLHSSQLGHGIRTVVQSRLRPPLPARRRGGSHVPVPAVDADRGRRRIPAQKHRRRDGRRRGTEGTPLSLRSPPTRNSRYLVLPKRKRSSGGLDALVNHLRYFFNKTE